MSSLTNSTLRTGGFAASVLILVGALLVGPGVVAAQESPAEQTITASVTDSGDTTLRIALEYDLSSASEKEAFTDISSDETAIQETESRFADRMSRVANAISNETDRSVTVTSTDVTFSQTDTVGTVVLQTELSNLAKQTSDGDLVLTQPFTGDFAFDGDLAVVAPDGYSVASATPEPDETHDSELVWDAGSVTDEFSVTMTPDSTTGQSSPTQTPGMGVFVALIGVALAVSVVVLRR